ncbi:hypothetical protein M3Y99_01720500 [Aphelenchoides fujianensis]|nr:hypothetical protein M3Y99_01720500 [Aphelenchoides fujianensis]
MWRSAVFFLLTFFSTVVALNETTNHTINSLLMLYPNMTAPQRMQFDAIVQTAAANETDETLCQKLDDFASTLGDGLKAAYRDIKYGVKVAAPYVEIGVQGIVQGAGWLGEHTATFLKSAVKVVKSGAEEVKDTYNWVNDFVDAYNNQAAPDASS